MVAVAAPSPFSIRRAPVEGRERRGERKKKKEEKGERRDPRRLESASARASRPRCRQLYAPGALYGRVCIVDREGERKKKKNSGRSWLAYSMYPARKSASESLPRRAGYLSHIFEDNGKKRKRGEEGGEETRVRVERGLKTGPRWPHGSGPGADHRH